MSVTSPKNAWRGPKSLIASINLRSLCCSEGAATQAELDEIRKKVKKEVRNEQKTAWADFRASVRQ